jgi:hypothetical protein
VIDFDRAIVAAPGERRLARQGCDRFWRSMTKLTSQRGMGLDGSERRWLERGYAR